MAEFVDRGESARSANRPELQRLLEYVKTNRVDYVIVHKVDRLARNRADDVEINLALEARWRTLVSVTENIDETPSGMLLHGIMSSIAEFYSRNLSHEIKTKTLKKIEAGGTHGLAPIGYLNVRRIVDGRELRTVEVDPERAPLIAWAFEAYASGGYSLRDLTAELQERGFTQRATRTQPERNLGFNHLQRIFKRKYYVGIVTFRGLEYEGKHTPLVTPQVFETVGRLLEANRRSGERSYRRDHYLKGTVRCGRCQSRLLYFVSTGNGGRYEYFHCSSRHAGRGSCDLPHLPAHQVEAAVADRWLREVASPAEVVQLRAEIEAELRGFSARTEQEAKRVQTRLQAVRRDRLKWAEKAMSGAVPDDIAREKQAELARQVSWCEEELQTLEVNEEQIEALLDATLGLAVNCHLGYQSADGNGRRLWNQAWFESVEIDLIDDGIEVSEACREAVPDAVHAGLAAVRSRRVGLVECQEPPSSGRLLVRTSNIWWRRWDSNPRPPACKAGALAS